MPRKNASILRSIRGVLAIGLVFLSLASAACAETGDRNQAFIRAAKEGRKEDVTRLLNSGADVNAWNGSGLTALIWAASRGDEDIVKVLLTKGADVNAKDGRGHTALMEAALSRRPSMVKLLLDGGADINARNRSGSTALAEAAAKNDLEMVIWLVDNAADVNAPNHFGSTPLITATSRNTSTSVLKILLDKGANVNSMSKNGWTALMWGVSEGPLEVVELLLDKGADVNAKTVDGRTALMMAAAGDRHYPRSKWYDRLWVAVRSLWNYWGPYYSLRGNDPQRVKLLLQKGADVNAQDKDGRTALKCALTNDDPTDSKQIVELLKAHGAKE